MPPADPLPALQLAIERPPRLRQDRGPLLFCLAATFLVGLGLHMLDYPNWDTPLLQVQGEYIQATHDAYHWLAGAVGLGKATGQPMAELARLGQELLGVLPGNLGFFAPAVAAGLAGLAMALLAWTLGGVEGGLLAGAMTVLAPGFFYRTRLGYYDTDMVTLLFPLLLCWGMAHWIRPHLCSTWQEGLGHLKATRGAVQDAAAPTLPGLLALLAFGLAARFCGAWHEHIALFAMLLFCMALAMALLMALPGRRGPLLLGLSVFGLCAFLGRWGLVAASLLLACAGFFPGSLRLFTRSAWPGLVLALSVLLAAGLAQELLFEGLGLVERYGNKAETGALAPAATQSTPVLDAPEEHGQSVIWPQVMPSVLEAQNISLFKLLLRIHPWPWLALLGLAGFLFALCLRPLAVFLLPLFFLGLASVYLGGRMAMFAAPVAGLGLALPLCWAGRTLLPQQTPAGFDWRPVALLAGFVLASLLALAPAVRVFSGLTPTPVLTKAHATALAALQHKTPQAGMIWTWWDWGYPTQYYARRRSFADGGQHYGYRIYPLALALTSASPAQAAGVIRYSALQDYTPWRQWQRQSPQQVQQFLTSLVSGFEVPPAAQPQYLVVTMENFRLMYWISYYGSWDIQEGQGVHARVVELTEAFDVDYEAGRIAFPEEDGMILELASADVIEQGELQRHRYPGHPEGYHLIIEDQGEHFYLMDDLAYDSQAVQLLLHDPEAPGIRRYFQLVHDGFPAVRIYKVR